MPPAEVGDSSELKMGHVISGWSQIVPSMLRLESEFPVLRVLSPSRGANILLASSPMEQRMASN